ncbi:MAG: hypothetical protein KDA96_16990, partial [Planctomycetaceae bacterium]|nr:hypothetical protein [Planctomycetaceae bacterium]
MRIRRLLGAVIAGVLCCHADSVSAFQPGFDAIARALDVAENAETAPGKNPQETPVTEPTLIWANGDRLVGEFQGGNDSFVRWSSPFFEDPLEISLSVLSGVRFPTQTNTPQTAAGRHFRILLATGDILFGQLKRIDGDVVSFESERHGAFSLNRRMITSLQQADATGILYFGPRGMDGWKSTNATRSSPHRLRVWTDRPDGSLTTDAADAAIQYRIRLPERFELELLLKSTETPAFQLALSSDPDKGLRLDVWDEFFVLANGDQFQQLETLPDDLSQLHVKVYVDFGNDQQPERRPTASVYTADGRLLGALPLTGARNRANAISLRSRRGGLTLRMIRLSRWDGTPPQAVQSGKTRVQLSDGTIAYGTIASLQEQTLELTDDGQIQQIPLESITTIVLQSDVGTAENASVAGPQVGDASISWSDGGFMSGQIVAANDSHLTVKTTYSNEPMTAALLDASEIFFPRVKSDTNSQAVPSEPAANPQQPVAESLPQEAFPDILSYNAGSLHGSLVTEGQSTNPLQWIPVGAKTGTPFRTDRPVRIQRQSVSADAPVDATLFPDAIYLKNNDVLPCRLESCDESQLHIATPFADVRQFATADVRAVELGAGSRTRMMGFGDRGWALTGGNQKSDNDVQFRQQGTLSHSNLLTGETVSFRMQWNEADTLSFETVLFGERTRGPKQGIGLRFMINGQQVSAIPYSLKASDQQMQIQMQMMAINGAQGSQKTVVAEDCIADVEMTARNGNLEVRVNGSVLQTIPLKDVDPANRAFTLNISMAGFRGSVVMFNGRVRRNDLETSPFRISNFIVENRSG